jgi:fumarylacetoacetate (FAA) hydrolase
MKLVTIRNADGTTSAAVILTQETGEEGVAARSLDVKGNALVLTLPYPDVLALLRSPEGIAQARQQLAAATAQSTHFPRLSDVVLLSPLPEPPSLRDFMAFEQHVRNARRWRGLDVQPEWYEFPTFYFSNTSEIYGPEDTIPYPVGSQALDYELEVACVIGRTGKNIPQEEAEQYIAGYLIMNDWSARDVQRKDMAIGLGPGKGKDFATSLGPWLVTPDELAVYRSGETGDERYDMAMSARVNGQQLSYGNFKTIHYSFSRMIAWASQNARLRIGDVLGSGTVGTGCLLELGTQVHRWLLPGDVVELEVTGLGCLRNRIG